MNITRPIALSAAAIVVVFGLTGCFGNPLESLAQNGVEQMIEQATGSDVSVDTDGTGASLPDNFPSEIPVVDGRIISSMNIEGTWSVTIAVDGLDAAKDGYADLLSSGFTETAALDLGEGNGLNAAETDKYTVSYSWLVDSDGNYTVNYGVGAKE